MSPRTTLRLSYMDPLGKRAGPTGILQCFLVADMFLGDPQPCKQLQEVASTSTHDDGAGSVTSQQQFQSVDPIFEALRSLAIRLRIHKNRDA